VGKSGNIFTELDIPEGTPRKVLASHHRKVMVMFHPDKIQSRMTILLPSDRIGLTEYATGILDLKRFLACGLMCVLYVRALKTYHAFFTTWQPGWPKRKPISMASVEPDVKIDVEQS